MNVFQDFYYDVESNKFSATFQPPSDTTKYYSTLDANLRIVNAYFEFNNGSEHDSVFNASRLSTLFGGINNGDGTWYSRFQPYDYHLNNLYTSVVIL